MHHDKGDAGTANARINYDDYHDGPAVTARWITVQ